MLPPLIIVVFISMVKDAYEDYKRHKADRSENEASTNLFSRQANGFIGQLWKDIEVGDIVQVRDEQSFPADMIIISSSEPDGTFYVETKNLDGETSLKQKSVAQGLNGSY